MVADQGKPNVLSDAEIDRIFHALADATRRDIVTRTMRSDGSISELAQGYLMSFAAVQKHVAVLERAGLVTKQRRGREQLVRAVPETLRRANELLARYETLWRARVATIDDTLAEPEQGTTATSPRPPRGTHPTKGTAR
ncbi:metalloregulator ArsR/SmtB family transcription factor [Humibacter sp.]|jgi:DNA-binding transcriptional ArsR family regulator|uniref:ArsR/SmtB family transcription factor n=1 Tax=Humibacter sp. TaxID=1940291 RepID=UPI002C1405A1|nr:metalloregulator ArsR/SmtB family transcription factor [Humibacter sp.]HVX08572.1 metalloregulator ArsR/SmtB family transcription factor [Humibacter sp.]